MYFNGGAGGNGDNETREDGCENVTEEHGNGGNVASEVSASRTHNATTQVAKTSLLIIFIDSLQKTGHQYLLIL
jgi:hypothetical protein